MAVKRQEGEYYAQIGITALRAPDGTFLPSVPLYIKVSADEVNQESGLSSGESELAEEIGKVLAKKYGEYIEGIKHIENHRKAAEK